MILIDFERDFKVWGECEKAHGYRLHESYSFSLFIRNCDGLQMFQHY